TRVGCQRFVKPLIKSESELTVDASITAKPFFERYGFQTVKQQRVECRGEWFINFICVINSNIKSSLQ
ncbi:putative acyltransferase, partial [Escherichia coli O104:H4 str. LB226692]